MGVKRPIFTLFLGYLEACKSALNRRKIAKIEISQDFAVFNLSRQQLCKFRKFISPKKNPILDLPLFPQTISGIRITIFLSTCARVIKRWARDLKSPVRAIKKVGPRYKKVGPRFEIASAGNKKGGPAL